MLKKIVSRMSLVAFVLLILTGCTSNKTTNTSESTTAKEEMNITITDTLDRTVKVPKNPKKIIVFDMGSLDTIKALGHQSAVVATAVDSLPKYLSAFESVESVGSLKEPDLEKINAVQPDLIIISGRQQDYLEQLEKIAPTLYLAVDTTDIWTSTQENVQTLAKIFAEEDKAQQEIDALDQRITALNEKTAVMDEKALIVLINEGQLSAYGKGSRFGIVHDVFGFQAADEQIEASTHGQSTSYEYILETNPDILFVVDRTKAIGGDESNNDVTKSELVAQTKAAKKEQIISLSADVWYLSGGGITSTNLMLDDVEKTVK